MKKFFRVISYDKNHQALDQGIYHAWDMVNALAQFDKAFPPKVYEGLIAVVYEYATVEVVYYPLRRG